MTELSLFFRYAIRLLLIAGPIEFLLGRTLSRVGGMLDPSPVTDVVNTVATAGLRLLEPMNVLALGTLAVAAAWPWLAPGGPTEPPRQSDDPLRGPGKYPDAPLPWPRLWTPLIAVF